MLLSAMVLLLGASNLASADDLSCVSTTFRFTSPSDKVCISEFDDAKVPGVTCFISQARKGGWGQPLGLNEDPSNFSVSCRQMGPISADISKLPEKEEAFTEKTSIFFKAHLPHRRFAGECDPRRAGHALAGEIDGAAGQLALWQRNEPVIRRGDSG